MDDTKAEEIALKALRLHIARVEDEGDKPLSVGMAIELSDQLARSNGKAFWYLVRGRNWNGFELVIRRISELWFFD